MTRPLRIGIGAPLSGRAAGLGREMANAIQLAADDCSAQGGVGGRSIELALLDDEGDERTGEHIARRFAADQSIVAVVGHYNSNVTLGAAPIYDAAGLALLAPIVSNPRLTKSGWSNVFRFTNRDDHTGSALASYLLEVLGKRSTVIVETGTVYGHSMTEQFVHAYRRGGGAVRGHWLVGEGETEFDMLVGNFASDAEMVFYGGTFEGAPLLRAMRKRGDTRLLATGDGCWDIVNFLKPAGADAEAGEGVLILSACPQLGQVEGSDAFASRFQHRFGAITNYAVNAYDATAMLVDAMRSVSQRAHPIDRPAIAQALRSISRRGIAYEAVVMFDDRGDNCASVTALHVVEHGRFRQIAVIPNELTKASVSS